MHRLVTRNALRRLVRGDHSARCGAAPSDKQHVTQISLTHLTQADEHRGVAVVVRGVDEDVGP